MLLLVLLAGEAMTRIEDRIRWGTPILSTATSTADLTVRDAQGIHAAPGARFRKWRINSVGTRGPEPDAARQQHRVLTLGASETFGLYESADHEYARQLADSLIASGCPADVLNAAFVGMSLPTVEQDVRLRLAALAPRVAVYYPTPPQYLDAELPRPASPDSSGRATSARPFWRAGFPWHSRFLMRVRDQLKSMLPQVIQNRMKRADITRERARWPAESLFKSVPGDRLAAFDRDLRTFVGTLRKREIVPVLVTHANAFIGSPPASYDRLVSWARFYPRANAATLIEFDSAAAEVVRRVGADSSVTVVDAWLEFHGIRADSMFADFSHFTDAGAARMARLLRPAVAPGAQCN